MDKPIAAPAMSDEDVARRMLDEVNRELVSHRKVAADHSYLRAAIDYVIPIDHSALRKVESEKTAIDLDIQHSNFQAVAKQVPSIEKDVASLKTREHIQDTVDNVSAYALKLGVLFIPGAWGYAASAAAWSLDEAKPNDPAKDQAVDFALGAAKGGVLKFGADSLLEVAAGSPALTGVEFGAAFRFVNNSLTRQKYLNPATNQYDLQYGLKNALSDSLNPTALAIDAVTFGTAAGGFAIANKAFGGALVRNPFLASESFALVSGFTSGALRESEHELETRPPQSLDFTEIGKQGVISAGISMVAASPGAAIKQVIAARTFASPNEAQVVRSTTESDELLAKNAARKTTETEALDSNEAKSTTWLAAGAGQPNYGDGTVTVPGGTNGGHYIYNEHASMIQFSAKWNANQSARRD